MWTQHLPSLNPAALYHLPHSLPHSNTTFLHTSVPAQLSPYHHHVPHGSATATSKPTLSPPATLAVWAEPVCGDSLKLHEPWG